MQSFSFCLDSKIRGWYNHPRGEANKMSKTETVELAVLCLVHQGELLLLQNRVKQDWRGWAIPGGHVESGESIVDAVIREMREETGLTVPHPTLCGIKQFPIEGGRYLVFLFETEEFSGTLRSSGEGQMRWISRGSLGEFETVADLDILLDVMLKPELTEFQYLVSGVDWTVRLR